MKYLKSYNERLGDILSAPNDDEILNRFKNMSNYNILKTSLENNYIKGVEIVLNNKVNFEMLTLITKYLSNPKINKNIIQLLFNNNEIINFLNKDLVYVIKKYILDSNDNIEKPYEKWLIELLKNIKSIPYRKEHGQYIYYCKNTDDEGNIILSYLPKEKAIYVNHYDIWSYLSKDFYLGYDVIKLLCKYLISKYLNIEINDVYQSSI